MDSETMLAVEQYNNFTAMLKGVPPPSSITISKYSVTEMLQRYKDYENSAGFGLNDGNIMRMCKTRNLNLFCNYLNTSDTSEKIESLIQKVQERYIQLETMSSCNIWFHSTLQSCGSAKKLLRMKQRIGISPGRRLSHLARRRQFFSSANLQHLANSENIRQIEIKKSVNYQPERRKSSTFVANEKLNSSKRALFLSPENESSEKYERCTNMGEKRFSFDLDERQKLPLQENSKGLEVTNWLLRQDFSADFPKKRLRDECTNHSSERKKKCPRRSLNFEDEGVSKSPKTHLPLNNSNFIDKKIPTSVNKLSQNHKNKLLWTVSVVLKEYNISRNDENFKICASTLFHKCRRNLNEILNLQNAGGTSEKMLQFARQHMNSVFEELGIHYDISYRKVSESNKNITCLKEKNHIENLVECDNMKENNKENSLHNRFGSAVPNDQLKSSFKTPRKIVPNRSVKSCQKMSNRNSEKTYGISFRRWNSLESLTRKCAHSPYKHDMNSLNICPIAVKNYGVVDMTNEMSPSTTFGQIQRCIARDNQNFSEFSLTSRQFTYNRTFPCFSSVNFDEAENDITEVFSNIPGSVKEENCCFTDSVYSTLYINQKEVLRHSNNCSPDDGGEICDQDKIMETGFSKLISEGFNFRGNYNHFEREDENFNENNYENKAERNNVEPKNDIVVPSNALEVAENIKTTEFDERMIDCCAAKDSNSLREENRDEDSNVQANELVNVTESLPLNVKCKEDQDVHALFDGCQNNEDNVKLIKNTSLENNDSVGLVSSEEFSKEKGIYKPHKLVVKKSKRNWKVVQENLEETENESNLRLKMRLSHEWEIVCRNNSSSDLGNNSEYESDSFNCSQVSSVSDEYDTSSDNKSEDSNKNFEQSILLYKNEDCALASTRGEFTPGNVAENNSEDDQRSKNQEVSNEINSGNTLLDDSEVSDLGLHLEGCMNGGLMKNMISTNSGGNSQKLSTSDSVSLSFSHTPGLDEMHEIKAFINFDESKSNVIEQSNSQRHSEKIDLTPSGFVLINSKYDHNGSNLNEKPNIEKEVLYRAHEEKDEWYEVHASLLQSELYTDKSESGICEFAPSVKNTREGENREPTPEATPEQGLRRCNNLEHTNFDEKELGATPMKNRNFQDELQCVKIKFDESSQCEMKKSIISSSSDGTTDSSVETENSSPTGDEENVCSPYIVACNSENERNANAFELKKRSLSLENYKARKRLEERSHEMAFKVSSENLKSSEAEEIVPEQEVKEKNQSKNKIYNIRLKHPLGEYREKQKHKYKSNRRHRSEQKSRNSHENGDHLKREFHREPVNSPFECNKKCDDNTYIDLKKKYAKDMNDGQTSLEGNCSEYVNSDVHSELDSKPEKAFGSPSLSKSNAEQNPDNINVQTIVDALSALAKLVDHQIKLENEKMNLEKTKCKNKEINDGTDSEIKKTTNAWIKVVSTWCGKNLNNLKLQSQVPDSFLQNLDENLPLIKEVSNKNDHQVSQSKAINLNNDFPLVGLKKDDVTVNINNEQAKRFEGTVNDTESNIEEHTATTHRRHLLWKGCGAMFNFTSEDSNTASEFGFVKTTPLFGDDTAVSSTGNLYSLCNRQLETSNYSSVLPDSQNKGLSQPKYQVIGKLIEADNTSSESGNRNSEHGSEICDNDEFADENIRNGSGPCCNFSKVGDRNHGVQALAVARMNKTKMSGILTHSTGNSGAKTGSRNTIVEVSNLKSLSDQHKISNGFETDNSDLKSNNYYGDSLSANQSHFSNSNYYLSENYQGKISSSYYGFQECNTYVQNEGSQTASLCPVYSVPNNYLGVQEPACVYYQPGYTPSAYSTWQFSTHVSEWRYQPNVVSSEFQNVNVFPYQVSNVPYYYNNF